MRSPRKRFFDELGCELEQSTTHEQVWVKVNAPVDKGISELVEALSRFPHLHTIESCEGPPAWVCFVVGEHGWHELAARLLGHIGPAIAAELGDLAHISIHVCETGLAQGELTVRPDAMDDIVSLLHRLADQRGIAIVNPSA